MCSEDIYIAGRYNKYLRNLSQSPWIDKDDVRIKHSVQELIEDGLSKYLKFDKSVFSSSGREDVDVRMLGNGRPFVFKLVNPWNVENYNQATMSRLQEYINVTHATKIRVRDLQVVAKESVSKSLKIGEENKEKEYRALCCCSRGITQDDQSRISTIENLVIDQKTPIRVLHRRSLAVRRRKIHKLTIEEVKLGEFESATPDNIHNLFALTLRTEAGTYIKEFVHGDFGRTKPSLSNLLGNCDTDLVELDVLVYLDWPPLIESEKQADISCVAMATRELGSEASLTDLYNEGMKAMKKAEATPRGEVRQTLYLRARRDLEKALDICEGLSLFSENESIDDIATTDIKYLLLPAYLAKIFISAESSPNRLETFERAEILMKRFLQRIINYGLGNEAVKSCITSETSLASTKQDLPSIENAMNDRNEKIEKFKRMKLLESRLDELDRRITSGQEVAEETIREYNIELIHKWIEDTVDSLDREVKPAIYFEQNRSTGFEERKLIEPKPYQKPQTVTIVKNELQKQVFGLGYPSKPTVTVDEFISKKINDGDLAFQAQKEVYANSLQRYAEQPDLLREQEELSDADHDEKEEKEDVEELKKKRQWDEFKDDNPTGSGNRHNMG